MGKFKSKAFYKITVLIFMFLIVLSVAITIYAIVTESFNEDGKNTVDENPPVITIEDKEILNIENVATSSSIAYIGNEDKVDENNQANNTDNNNLENQDTNTPNNDKINSFEPNSSTPDVNNEETVKPINETVNEDTNQDDTKPDTKIYKSEAVTDDYFDDAVFIGNSQIEGIGLYKSMSNATIYAGKGITVDTIFTKQVIKQSNGTRETIMNCLANNKFGKIYILLGANELGWPYESVFLDKYTQVIEEIKRTQPGATIYVSSILPIADSKSSGDPVYNNKNVERFNKTIYQMTQNTSVNYLDSYEAFADENGCLPEDAGPDGIHLNSTYYEKWFDYMKTHTLK